MDPERQIRFLYPPLFFVASLAWGVWLDPAYGLDDIVPAQLFKDTSSAVLTVIAGGGILVTALGLLINTIPWTLFRLIAKLSSGQSHEAILSVAALERIRRIVGYPRNPSARETLFLVATFDHGTLPSAIHRWLLRRWNAFNVNASVVSALLLAWVFGWRLGVRSGWEWTGTSLIIALVFGLMAYWAWRDTMGMLEFQAELLVPTDGRTDLQTDGRANTALQPTSRAHKPPAKSRQRARAARG